MYDWGTYESSIDALYENSDDPQKYAAMLTKQIQKLSAEVERNRFAGRKPIPPGKLAHLGYLYALAGNREKAVECFIAEKEAYPESAHFVDVALEVVR